VLGLGVDLGLMALALGTATASRTAAIGITTALAAVSYVISSLAPVVHFIGPLRYASPFYWAVGHNQPADGVGSASFAVLAAVALAATAAAVVALERLDVR